MSITKDESKAAMSALLRQDRPAFITAVRNSRYLNKDQKIDVLDAYSEYVAGNGEATNAVDRLLMIIDPAPGSATGKRRAPRGEIRDWARQQGIELADRGRVPDEVARAWSRAKQQG